MAKELRLSQELPLSSDMERRTATRLSVMERSQAETNKKLESLHNLMQTVLTTVSLVKLGEDVTGDRISTLSVRETVGNKDEGRAGTEALHRGEGSSKHCWDKLTKHSDDDVKEFEVHVF
ncbi:hypothetical protein KC19_VG321500 [Ceratodon purpureus]|uniref:Uncharacterized protein n=1 Tax=Ceratodon purpureus TaxID=3225 RepID=A0A8T0HVS9_CERPU|nr:hypothetical protein KC19_VG321500 [Ceratodon purpureus]